MFLLIHTPLPNDNAMSRIGYPVGGAIDAVIEVLPPEMKRTAIRMEGSPFSYLMIRSSFYLKGYNKLSLGEFCDGYLILGPLREMEGVTPIRNFVNLSNIDEAINNFSGAKEGNFSVKQFNEFIGQEAYAINKAMKNFQ